MKEYKIGERFTDNGITYVCVQSVDTSCDRCVKCMGTCYEGEREDGNNVHFEVFSEKDKLIAEMVDILKRCEMTDEIRDAIKKAEEIK